MVDSSGAGTGHSTPDIYTEPDGDPDTLANLGPLRPMAGVWEGTKGADQHPDEQGTGADRFIEHYELQPIDFQTNGPQLFYGLQYHTRLVKPGEVAMFHQQVGFWLWEPNTCTVILTLAIPRGQVALAAGRCEPDATAFEVTAERGTTTYGIASNPFLDENFTTTHFRMTVTVNPDGTWTYDENTKLLITGRSEPFDHTDRKPQLQVFILAKPTSQLAGNRHSLDNSFHHPKIHGLARLGTIQINQVKPGRSFRLPAFGHLHRVVGKNRFPGIISLDQPDTLSITNINGGEQNH